MASKLETAVSVLTGVAAVCVIVVALFGSPSQWSKERTSPPRETPGAVALMAEVQFENSPSKGSIEAPVVVIEFSDFDCPFCRKFASSIMPNLDREFIETGKVQWFFKNLPLKGLHPEALRKANVGDCLKPQGRFWDFYSHVFSNPPRSVSNLMAYAESLSKDPIAFRTCLAAGQLDQVQSDTELAQSLGLMSTPTFLIGRRQAGRSMQVLHSVSGAQPVERFREAILRLLDPTQ